MIKIGITGGIGSGKSIVSTLFRLHDIPVYNADEETKKLNDTSAYIRKELTANFGDDLYVNNQLDRKKFANIIFSDAKQLELANSIIHPEVAKHFNQWCEDNAHHPIVAMEAAILFESGFQKYLNKVVTVYSPLRARISRVSARNNLPQEMIENRIKHQMPEGEKIGMAEYVIINDYKNSLIVQVQKLIDELMLSSFMSQ